MAGPPERQFDRGDHFIRLKRRRHEAGIELAKRDLPDAANTGYVNHRIIGGTDGGQFGRWIGVREAAADRAAVTRLAMADVMQRFGHQRAMPGDFRCQFEFALAHHRADAKLALSNSDTAQVVDAAEINEMIDDHVAKIHHRHERLSAGDDLGVRQRGQQFGSFLELPRRMIVEGCWLHIPGTQQAWRTNG